MIPACETLFLPFETGALAMPQGRSLFLNALPHGALSKNSVLVQPFRPYAERLVDAGFVVENAALPEPGAFESAFLLSPKNQREAEYELARACMAVSEGGLVVCAAANDAGGTRLSKMAESMGLENIGSLSKHKCRVVWGVKRGNNDRQGVWLAQGEVQKSDISGFYSRPGLFSWDRLDKGSEILLRFLPPDIKGRGGDFGCGYGALAQAVLKNRDVQELTCLDADARSLECCRLNLGSDARVHYEWADLTRLQAALRDLDFIVMNPPFHEGRFEASAIGQGFIKTASESLRKGGRLFMVANTHLPYEALLESLFTRVQKLHQEAGFKIIEAVR